MIFTCLPGIKIKTKVLQEQILEMNEGLDLIFAKHEINQEL